MIGPSINQSFESDGYVVIPSVLGLREIDDIASATTGVLGEKAGTRRLLESEWCSLLAYRLAVDPRLSALVPTNAQAVQCTLFVKTVESNWLVSLHQDLSIPVSERLESPRCSGWSQKQGDIFVQPPISVLEQIAAIRVHLDDCDERNGALRVVPGSHRLGRVTTAAAVQEREVRGERVVSVPRGGVMVMRPLLLHASSKTAGDLPRRVLHFVFGPPTLPDGLRWPTRKRSPLRVS